MPELTKLKIQIYPLLLAVVLIFGHATAANPSEPEAGEANVMVAYLYNFGKFINWPASAFASPEVPIHYCFYGDNSLGQAVDTLAGKQVKGHPVKVVHIRRGGSLDACHVLYIDLSERFYIRPILNLIREKPVLTISGIDSFATDGGVIGLIFANNKLKFEINSVAAKQAQLQVSSQVLKLAANVINRLPQ